ncbi:MAG: hypothetical protein V3W18_13385 [candidate division Zixibacteria bacterium]
MPDQTITMKKDKKPIIQEKENQPKKNSAVTKERIERLKKAFKPRWLLNQINAPDKNTSKKNK